MMIRLQKESKMTFRPVLSILFILAIPIILSSLLSCRVSVQGEPYHQGPGPRPAHSIEGLWLVDFHKSPGKLEFIWTRGGWAGRFWDEGHRQWEELTDIFFDPHTGQLQFSRPHGSQQWSGTVSGNRIQGTFSAVGWNYLWEAWRH